jgi:hypothetical protein
VTIRRPRLAIFVRQCGIGFVMPCRDSTDKDDGLRQIAARLLHSLPPGDEVARIGEDSFAVLTYMGSATYAGKTAAHLQRVLADDGFSVTFGWAAYRRTARTRSRSTEPPTSLYARRVIHRQSSVIPLPSPASSA